MAFAVGNIYGWGSGGGPMRLMIIATITGLSNAASTGVGWVPFAADGTGGTIYTDPAFGGNLTLALSAGGTGTPKFGAVQKVRVTATGQAVAILALFNDGTHNFYLTQGLTQGAEAGIGTTPAALVYQESQLQAA